MVLIRRSGGLWREPDTSAYQNEKELQDLVKISPSLLPGGEPLAIVDELVVPDVGSIDLVGISSAGDITLVECKLRANPEIRREVVGQILAYAGGLWRMGYDQFASAFATRAGKTLPDAVREAIGVELDEGNLRASIGRKLEEGEFRLIIAVDAITSELQRIIEYLNEHTLPGIWVLGLELAYGKDADIELLIPNVYGLEARGTATRSRWDEATFGEQVQALTKGLERAFIERLLQHGTKNGHHPSYGEGAKPGMSYYYDIGGRPVSVWALYLKEPVPKVAISLGAISNYSVTKARRLLEHLKSNPILASALKGVDETTLHKYPQIRIDPFLLDEAAQATFFQALNELISASAPPDAT